MEKQQVLPKGYLGKAITYALNQWPKLLTYLDDGDISIDNNVTERDIRPFTTGRKKLDVLNVSQRRACQCELIQFSDDLSRERYQSILLLQALVYRVAQASTYRRFDRFNAVEC